MPTPGDLSDPGIELASPASPALAGRFFITELYYHTFSVKKKINWVMHFILTMIEKNHYIN